MRGLLDRFCALCGDSISTGVSFDLRGFPDVHWMPRKQTASRLSYSSFSSEETDAPVFLPAMQLSRCQRGVSLSPLSYHLELQRPGGIGTSRLLTSAAQ